MFYRGGYELAYLTFSVNPNSVVSKFTADDIKKNYKEINKKNERKKRCILVVVRNKASCNNWFVSCAAATVSAAAIAV